MDKYIFDENNGLWYKRQGDYYIPCLLYPPKKNTSLSAYGSREIFFLPSIYFTKIINLYIAVQYNNYIAVQCIAPKFTGV